MKQKHYLQKPLVLYVFDYDFDLYFILPLEGKHYVHEDRIELVRIMGLEPQSVQAAVN